MIRALIRFFPSVSWRVRTSEKILFLTFDDGPVPGATPDVLDVLKRHEAKATFFCVGENVNRHPEIFNRISSEGHLAANHSFTHPKGWHVSLDDYLKDVDRCSEILAVYSTANMKRPLFRPPYGKLKWSQFLALRRRYKLVMWDVLTRDWEKDRSAESCFRRVVRKARPGSIIVFHDSIKARERMLPALENTLRYYSARGYRFNTLAELESFS